MATPRRLSRVFAFIVFFGTIGAVIALIRLLLRYFAQMGSDFQKAMLTAAIAIVGSVVSLALAKTMEYRATIRKELRDRKAPVYEEIIQRFFAIFHAEKQGKPKAGEAELLAFFVDSVQKLTIWGSNEVVEAFGRVRTEGGGDSTAYMFVIEDWLLAMRKDLGHSAVPRGSVLRLFVNDIDDVLKKMRQST